MQKTIWSQGHRALIDLIIDKRKAAGLKQEDVAKALGQTQPWVAHLESYERRVDVIEYVRIARVIGFDPSAELEALAPVILGERP
ncbi:helix-turn-helix domain-containing protein [Agrobacterium tumefaciens]|uniref:helix-turn-helix domain-containing protein n=1 Tax=Agrobacterium tumefaciens TaxID=358 RepID=UPI001571F705|nr:helix-turn-helix transcriptional regulator [Agrobacterium tumefaciens]NTB99100.1 helix-turn-helix domain-containing protein [Agrobacterium tumefaciens]NTC45047.1 helix-turn-helix domain-containing protein [Agrobacterium tumefaciens]